MPVLAVRASAQDDGKVLRVQMGLYPDTIDPQVGSALAEISIWVMIYEGLTRLDENLQTVPAAAESWTFNDDATAITFTLREGLAYSDGSPLTAENFRYAIERTCDPNVAGGYAYVLTDIVAGCAEFANLFDPEAATPVAADDTEAYEAAKANLGVTVVDDRTLEVRFIAPAPYFPTIASLWVFFPVKQELVEAGGASWWQDPANHLGNGPFVLTQLEEQQLAAFAPNEHYWGGRPVVDGIEYVYITDSAAALEAYRAGDIDVLGVDPAQIPEIKEDAELSPELLTYGSANTWYLNFNMQLEPFQDKKVREAFAYAFDRDTYCEVILNGSCVPTLQWVPPDVPGAIQTEAYAFDPEKAKQALAESSYGGPENLPEIKYYYNSDDPLNTTRAEWIAGQYREILGVELTLEPTEGTTLSGLRRDPATYPQFTIYNWYQDYPDPQNWLSIYWSCDSIFAVRVGYCNKEFDALVDQGDRETDPAARIPFYEQAHQILLDDLPGPPLFSVANVFLVKPYVTGYAPTSIDGGWPGERVSALTVDVNRT
jgi:oligopeptide transport system substrate-binding protein